MKTVTAMELHSNLENLLNEVLTTGETLEIRMADDQRLQIVAVDSANILQNDILENLVERPEVIMGDPDDLAFIHWTADGEIYHE